jgi:DNA-directed RNA polymerase subunit RPC12/RpoP
MRCARCDGLMVADSLIDIQESCMPMWMKGWRCVSCGNIVDPLIQQHRMIQQAGASRLLEKEVVMPQCLTPLKATG